jgi:hypothetical protein
MFLDTPAAVCKIGAAIAIKPHFNLLRAFSTD